MSRTHHTVASSRTVASSFAATAIAATLVTTLVAAPLPAQAATVPGAPAAPSTDVQSTYYVPAQAPTRVDFENKDADGSPVFPAGTYLITDTALSGYDFHGIETLSERFLGTTTTQRVVVLSEPGPLSLEIADAGAAGTTHWVDVQSVPQDFGDPAHMTQDAIWTQIGAARDAGLTAWDQAILTVADVPAAARAISTSIPEDGVDYLRGDVFGIGADVWVVQEGNRFTATGPEGKTLSMHFGRPGDQMLLGDWNGDGVETVGLRRGNQIFLDDDWNGGWAESSFSFGRTADEVFVGDFDGDGIDTVGIRRGNVFHLSDGHRGGNAIHAFTFGRPTDEVMIGDFFATGTDIIGVVRPTEGDLAWDGTLFLTEDLRGGAGTAHYRVAD